MLIYNHAKFYEIGSRETNFITKVVIFSFFVKMMTYNDDVSRIWSRDTLILVLNNLEYLDERKW